MAIPALVINLDRSEDRWEALSQRAAILGIELERVPAVDGNSLDRSEWHDFDFWKFHLWHGRRPLGAEYGCYMSHMRALDRVIDQAWPHAIILEDDAAFVEDFVPRIEALTRLGPPPDLVKLFNHRVKGFVANARTDAGDVVGRCVHGPNGSSMGYLVSLRGAQRLRAAALPMFLPYDISFERGWAFGADIRTTRAPLLAPADTRSTIVGYARTKFPFYMRVPTALFRGQDYVRRMIYALRG